MVKGFPLIDKPKRVCEGCIFGKQHRETFLVENSYRVRTPLEIVHFDICGPMQTMPIGGCKYFLTFIDDYSRKTWVYFLKHKSDAFSCFQQFKALVENQSVHRIKILRTDKGGEYVSNEFLNFLQDPWHTETIHCTVYTSAERHSRKKEQNDHGDGTRHVGSQAFSK